MGIICPICNKATSLSPVLIEDNKAYLPNRSSDSHAQYGPAVVHAITGDESPYLVGYGIFECQDCGKRFVAKKHRYEDEDWKAIYPISYKLSAKEIPEPLKSEFDEASLSFAVGAYRACVSMCQVVQESLCRQQEVTGLNELKGKGSITARQFNEATEIRLWANIIKHQPIHEIVKPEDAEALLTYLEGILHTVYVEPAHLDALREKRNQLKKAS